ncbi:MAG TPA: hypothetical protein VMI12_00220 [Puia sp.]|nr:hypothetical protein [Puia sp.]
MIKSLEILRPIDFPYRLFSFRFFFENINSHIINMHNVAGMDFIYEQIRICYVLPQNEFFQLLKLKNIEEPHQQKYETILMKGIFTKDDIIECKMSIENQKDYSSAYNAAIENYIRLNKLPEIGDEIAIADKNAVNLFHHFSCFDIWHEGAKHLPLAKLVYLNSYNNLSEIINPWLDHKDDFATLQ